MGTVIIINGISNIGKDTFIDFCSDITSVFNISTVDKVKEAGKILGCNDSKIIENRNFLGELKQLANKYYNHSEVYIHEKYLSIKKSTKDSINYNDFIIFIHCREPKEIDLFKNKYSKLENCITLLFTKEGANILDGNVPDKDIFKYEYDFVINNDGTLKDLKQKSLEFIKKIKNI